ncbi:MAG: DUF1444 family protein [Planctomycetaceae bacterium]
MSDDNDNLTESDSSDGQVFRGPANWFSLTVPDALVLEQTETFLEVRLRSDAREVSGDAGSGLPNRDLRSGTDAGWTMTIYAAWVEETEPQTRAASFHPATLFPRVSSYHAVAPLNLSGRCRTWAGVSSQRQPAAWWRSLFGKRSAYQWRLWIVEYRSIIIVASLQSQRGLALSDQTIQRCEQLMNSIRFADVQARPPELFRQDVVALGRQYFPLLEINAVGSFGIRIGESEINLANFYRSYLHDPERFRQIVLPGLTTVVRLQDWGPDQLMPDLTDVAERIMPMLYPAAEADSSLADFVRVPWVGGLSIMFVLDEDSTYRFVHERMLKRWELSLEQLEQRAMANLETWGASNPLEVTLIGEDDAPRMLVPVRPNAYNSVRLLGESLHGRLRQLLGTELVVGVPNRDFFVAVSLNHPQLISQVQQRVIQDYQSMHHPLTSRLLVISADGVSEYCEPPVEE